jgi:hypothetical protein
LNAGVLEGGVVTHSERGTPQGGVISPLLANIYLHEAVDKWWVADVMPRLRGRAALIRYADDFVMVFSSREDALRVQAVLPQRVARFGLTLHPEKTRLLDYRRPGGGDDGPGSFDFLGFNHHWGRTRYGGQAPMRTTSKSRFSRALRALDEWMARVRHRSVAWQARMLCLKLLGHFRYYGIRGNSDAIRRFRHETTRRWQKWLSRRSQRARISWPAFARLSRRHPLPRARLNPRPTPLLPFANP